MYTLSFTLPSVAGSQTTSEVMPSRTTERELEQIYRDHLAFVWRSARRLGVPEESLDDITQEVFVVAARRLAEFEGRSSMRTWLFAITLRVVQSHRRAWYRYFRKRDALAREVRAHEPPDPYERAEAADQLVRLLDTLPQRYRVVYVLGELEQMNCAEIARGLGVNHNTVYSRLREARKLMLQAVRRQQAHKGERR